MGSCYAIATITFIAGAFHMAHSTQPLLAIWEKHVATVLVSIVAVGDCWLLYKLQCHLRDTRMVIDPRDETAWRRGRDVVIAMAIVLIISAIAVCIHSGVEERRLLVMYSSSHSLKIASLVGLGPCDGKNASAFCFHFALYQIQGKRNSEILHA
jgi:hypothetical protein